MKKRRLKKWVKHLIALLYILVIITGIIYGINNLKNKVKECDNQKQRMCSIYELHNF